jgi:hypothetical protein
MIFSAAFRLRNVDWRISNPKFWFLTSALKAFHRKSDFYLTYLIKLNSSHLSGLGITLLDMAGWQDGRGEVGLGPLPKEYFDFS